MFCMEEPVQNFFLYVLFVFYIIYVCGEQKF